MIYRTDDVLLGCTGFCHGFRVYSFEYVRAAYEKHLPHLKSKFRNGITFFILEFLCRCFDSLYRIYIVLSFKLVILPKSNLYKKKFEVFGREFAIFFLMIYGFFTFYYESSLLSVIFLMTKLFIKRIVIRVI